MAKSIIVKLSFVYARIQKLLKFGKDHSIRTSAGTIKRAAVAQAIVDEALDIHFDPVFSKIIEKEGVTTLKMTRKLWEDYAVREGYMKRKGK